MKTVDYILILVIFVIGGFSFFQIRPAQKEYPCLSYSPETKIAGEVRVISKSEIEKDLEHLKKYTSCIRIYTLSFGLDYAPVFAEKVDMEVIVGIWLQNGEEERAQNELNILDTLLKNKIPIKYIIVGNETQLLHRYPLEKVLKIMNDLQMKTEIPIATAEMDHSYHRAIDLIYASDFIGLHVLPYWDGLHIEEATARILKSKDDMEEIYRMPAVLLEVGWPTSGKINNNAIPSLSNQTKLLEDISNTLGADHIFYNVIEAYDSSFKAQDEGMVGAHWGVFSQEGYTKSSKLRIQIVFIIIILITTYTYLMRRLNQLSPKISNIKKVVFASILSLIAYTTFQLVYEYENIYVGAKLYALIGIIIQVIILILFICEEMFSSASDIRDKNIILPLEYDKQKNHKSFSGQTFFSIHIPCKDEDAEVVIESIKACLLQDYSHFEIIVISNNTNNEANWKKIEAFCKNPQTSNNAINITFIHEDYISGFKGGALNLGLKYTNPEATHIALIDADYIVNPKWLSKSAQYILEYPAISILQYPQAYNLKGLELEKEMKSIRQSVMYEQEVGFSISYPLRTALGFPVVNGTMCVLHKQELIDAGGWDTTTICEDTMTGMRMQKNGGLIAYSKEVMGIGRPPLDFNSIMKQRIRWVFGTTQILKNICTSDKEFIKKYPKKALLYIIGWMHWLVQILFPLYLLLVFKRCYDLIFPATMPILHNTPTMNLVIALYIPVFVLILYMFITLYVRLKMKFRNILSLIWLEMALVFCIAYALLKAIFTSFSIFEVTDKSKVTPKPISDRKNFFFAVFSVFSLALMIYVFIVLAFIYRLNWDFSFKNEYISLHFLILVAFLPMLSYLYHWFGDIHRIK